MNKHHDDMLGLIALWWVVGFACAFVAALLLGGS